MTVFDVIDRSLAANQQNIIDTTQRDFDSDTFDIAFELAVKFRMKVTTQRQAISGDAMIWGHPTKGIWGVNKWGGSATIGFTLDHPLYGILDSSRLDSTTSAWETVQVIENA